MRPSAADRFEAKVVRDGFTDCWHWVGTKNHRGYGRFSIGARQVFAHRHCFERLVGPIPAHLELDHLCRNPGCVNPAHLEPVTHVENVRRGRVADAARRRQLDKTHCPVGHPYVGANLIVVLKPNGRTARECRECNRLRKRRRRLRVSRARTVQSST